MKGRGYLEIKDLGIIEVCEEKDGISGVNFRDIKLEEMYKRTSRIFCRKKKNI